PAPPSISSRCGRPIHSISKPSTANSVTQQTLASTACVYSSMISSGNRTKKPTSSASSSSSTPPKNTTSASCSSSSIPFGIHIQRAASSASLNPTPIIRDGFSLPAKISLPIPQNKIS